MLLITVLEYLSDIKEISNFYSLLQALSELFYSTTFEMSVAVTNHILHGA